MKRKWESRKARAGDCPVDICLVDLCTRSTHPHGAAAEKSQEKAELQPMCMCTANPLMGL